MRATVHGVSAGFPPNIGSVASTTQRIEITLDGQDLYIIRPSPPANWRTFSSGLLGTPRSIPDLPMAANLTASANVQRLDHTFLNPGERQQVLMSLVLLTSQLSDQDFLDENPFPSASAWNLFCDHIFLDGLRSSVYVLDLATTRRIQADPTARATMVESGYLFTLQIDDQRGNITELLFRPFNSSGFTDSIRWPDALQRLRSHIEGRRQRE